MFETERSIIEVLPAEDAPLLLRFYLKNQQHLAPWEPIRDDDFLTLSHFRQQLEAAQAAFARQSEFRFVALDKKRQQVLGVANFTAVARGAFQACFLGYSLDEQLQGQGLMAEILRPCIQYLFNDIGLNRVMANYMPANERSARVLDKLGFEKEGYARRYLKIAGQWQDHVLTAKVNNQALGQ
ncbi:ribosomal protein S5-alanine N-acetyltransferase [Gallaecimonas mangrovi]|uniref:ribosomal protein S5-alanine N-acetyltransferase n=1 Tax=Gallaecimonas mangrovi TaxID=2291597 RepID=UPI000E20BE39|nr:ribosomal protein S5-alanine N-acetyltransferase [Gallaecimonas mangrovi]